MSSDRFAEGETSSAGMNKATAVLAHKLKAAWQWIRCGTIHEHIVGFAGDHVPAEIEFRGRGNRLVGYWAFGHFDPTYPYQG